MSTTLTRKGKIPDPALKEDRQCPECGEWFREYRAVKKECCSISCASVRKNKAKDLSGATNPNYRGGKASHPLYQVYNDMIARCNRPTHARYKNYGGRGITVCQSWRDDFWIYVADVGARPAGPVRWSLDRIDNDGPYAPGNVRWATPSQQARNRRASAYAGLEHDPVTGQWRAVA